MLLPQTNMAAQDKRYTAEYKVPITQNHQNELCRRQAMRKDGRRVCKSGIVIGYTPVKGEGGGEDRSLGNCEADALQ